MSEKSKIQNIIEEWKQQQSPEDKALFLKKVEKDISQNSPEEFLENVKAVYAATEQLHVDVFNEESEYYKENILVQPQTKEDFALLKSLLEKMNIPYKKVS